MQTVWIAVAHNDFCDARNDFFSIYQAHDEWGEQSAAFNSVKLPLTHQWLQFVRFTSRSSIFSARECLICTCTVWPKLTQSVQIVCGLVTMVHRSFGLIYLFFWSVWRKASSNYVCALWVNKVSWFRLSSQIHNCCYEFRSWRISSGRFCDKGEWVYTVHCTVAWMLQSSIWLAHFELIWFDW